MRAVVSALLDFKQLVARSLALFLFSFPRECVCALHERNVALLYSLTIVNKLSVLIFRIQKLLILFSLSSWLQCHSSTYKHTLVTLLMLFDIDKSYRMNEKEASERVSARANNTTTTTNGINYEQEKSEREREKKKNYEYFYAYVRS